MAVRPPVETAVGVSVVPAYLREGHARYQWAYRRGLVCAADLEAELAYQKFRRRRKAGPCVECGEQRNDPTSKRCQVCWWSRGWGGRCCDIDGCDRPHAARGLCGVHYTRARRLRKLDRALA